MVSYFLLMFIVQAPLHKHQNVKYLEFGAKIIGQIEKKIKICFRERHRFKYKTMKKLVNNDFRYDL